MSTEPEKTMAASVETMTLPPAPSAPSSLAAERRRHLPPPAAGGTSSSSSSASRPPPPPHPAPPLRPTAAADAAASAAAGTASYTTPDRAGGLAAVTPGTLSGTPPEGGGAGGGGGAPEAPGAVGAGAGSSAAPSAPTSAAARGSVPSRASSPPAEPEPVPASAAKVSSRARVHAAHVAPSIQLGPRVTPAVRKAPPERTVSSESGAPSSARSSPVKPRNLGGALGDDNVPGGGGGGGSGRAPRASGPLPAPAAAAAAAPRCPSTPSGQTQRGRGEGLPPPSSFLAAKISPLRSSARRGNQDEEGGRGGGGGAMAEPPASPAILKGLEGLDTAKLSPGMFLSPRTPKPFAPEHRPGTAGGGTGAGTKTSGMIPGLTPGFTPTNFASDFGKGSKKEGGGLDGLDGNNMFAWLNSPTGQGLFTPGGLNSLSVTNTPRGMYGFSGPPGSTSKTPGTGAPGPPRLAPSPSRYPPSASPGRFYAELEAGGDAGMDTPKIPEGQRSMICISPMSSKRGRARRDGAAAGAEAATDPPDTPMSINFGEIFASPRLPTPRPSGRPLSAKEGDAGAAACSSSDGHPASPVASALHTAERDLNLDDDLNALLQLAGTTTPGGRPMTFMSPLLTNSLRRVAGASPPSARADPPSSLQLPIISGTSTNERGSPQRKMVRNGAAISPPSLAIRSTSASGASSPPKSSLKKKSKKRKAPTSAAPAVPTGLSPQHQQYPGYPANDMTHYRHPHAAASHPSYYHHQGYHAGSTAAGHLQHLYPSPQRSAAAPQQHYAYGETPPAAPAPVAKATSPPKSSKKSKSKKSKSSRSRARTTPKPPAVSTPAAPSSSSSSSKRSRKSSSKAAAAASAASKARHSGPPDPADRERITAAIYAVNTAYGDEKEEKLKAVALRGVTQRPSGKWQAQLYYAGKSRYIGVFDSKEKASLAYEIAREVLKTDREGQGPANAEETDRNVALARKAAFSGVSEHTGKK